jgi:hypothetical protein
MPKRSKKRDPNAILKLQDLEHSKTAILNSLPSLSSRCSYDHAIRNFIDWYCSEPRLAFNRTVVTRYRVALEQLALILLQGTRHRIIANRADSTHRGDSAS